MTNARPDRPGSLASQLAAGHALIGDDRVDFTSLSDRDRRLAALALMECVMDSSERTIAVVEETLAMVGLLASLCGVTVEEVSAVARHAAGEPPTRGR